MGKVGCLVNLAALLLGFLVGSVPEVDISGEVKKMVNFRFWIASDAHRVSFCSMYLCIVAIF